MISFLTGLSLFAHIFLLAVHVILLASFHRHYEHRVIVPLFKAGQLSVGVTVVSQVLGIGYTAFLVFLTQPLALKRYLNSRQTLSTFHDEMVAWSGLGQALMTLTRQVALPTGVIGVAMVALYLGSVTALHVTVPALFTVSNVNVTIPGQVIEDWSDTTFIPPAPASAILPALPIMSYGGREEMRGLRGNLVYGVVNNTLESVDPVHPSNNDYFSPHFDNLVMRDLSASAASFHINCRQLRDARQVSYNGTTGNATWVLETPLQNMTLTAIWPGLLRIAPLALQPLDGHSLDVLVYGHLNVTDASGNNGSYVDLNPAMYSDIESLKTVNSGFPPLWNRLQVMACTLDARFHNVTVSGVTGLVNATMLPPDSLPANSSTWQEWTNRTYDPKFDKYWDKIMLVDERSKVASSPFCGRSLGGPPPCGPQDFMNVVENYVNLRLKTYDSYRGPGPGGEEPLEQVSLRDVENALETATAAVIYAGHRLSSRSLIRQAEFLITQAQLNLNRVPLTIGTSASSILLLLFIFMVFPLSFPRRDGYCLATSNKGKDTSFSSELVPGNVGVLQAIWLFGKHPKTIEAVLRVDKPTTYGLRQAGQLIPDIHDVHDLELRERKRREGKRLSQLDWHEYI